MQKIKGEWKMSKWYCRLCDSNLNTSDYCMEKHFKRFHKRNKPREKMDKGKWNWSCNYESGAKHG